MLNSVLLVDDDRITNYLHERVIKKAGIVREIHTVENGLEALNFLIEKNVEDRSYPDLILVDINMPVMDGFEFLETFSKIKREEENVIVLMLSTSQDKNDIKKAEKFKINGYFNKPLTENKLKELLQNYFKDKIE